MRRLPLPAVLAGLAALSLSAACSTSNGGAQVAANAADSSFLQRMQPHHEQAIAAARIAQSDADDPRVRAFADRIVAEQSPELARMRAATTGAGLHLDLTAGADDAVDRISAAQLAQLAGLSGPAFDRRFLSLSITSEQGAVVMAKAEVAGGRDPAALAIAGPISGAGHSEIPELQTLLAQLV